MKNIYFLTFLLLFSSCTKETGESSDWSIVDEKIRLKDSLEAEKLAKKAEEAIQQWAGYPDRKPMPDSLKQDGQSEL